MGKIDESDVQGGRTVWYGGSGKQDEPSKDNRFRVNDSVRFYVVQLLGSHINIYDSGERVLYREKRQSYVMFEGAKHQLRPASKFKDLLRYYARYGCPIYLTGMDVTLENLNGIEPWPFIWIAPKAARDIFARTHLQES